MTASAPADCSAPFERYGLQLVEDPGAPPGATDAASARAPALGAFQWSLLAGLALLELAYLRALALFAGWAIRQVIGG